MRFGPRPDAIRTRSVGKRWRAATRELRQHWWVELLLCGMWLRVVEGCACGALSASQVHVQLVSQEKGRCEAHMPALLTQIEVPFHVPAQA